MWCTYRQCSEYTATFTTGFQRQLVNLNYIRKKCYNSTQKLTFGDQLKVGDWSEKNWLLNKSRMYSCTLYELMNLLSTMFEIFVDSVKIKTKIYSTVRRERIGAKLDPLRHNVC